MSRQAGYSTSCSLNTCTHEGTATQIYGGESEGGSEGGEDEAEAVLPPPEELEDSPADELAVVDDTVTEVCLYLLKRVTCIMFKQICVSGYGSNDTVSHSYSLLVFAEEILSPNVLQS